jgi:hypothetical protein
LGIGCHGDRVGLGEIDKEGKIGNGVEGATSPLIPLLRKEREI